MPCRVTLVDAYDSFVYILAAYFERLGCGTTVFRNDDPALINRIGPDHSDMLVLGPGPGHPLASGYSALLEKNAGKVPVLGICLGHQAIGLHYGLQVSYADRLMHGKSSLVQHDGDGCFASLGSTPIRCMRYHSIIVEDPPESAPLKVSARSLEDGYVMGLRHRDLPIESLQFHPESIGTDNGMELLKSFMESHVGQRGQIR